jgi:hypothetical protein
MRAVQQFDEAVLRALNSLPMENGLERNSGTDGGKYRRIADLPDVWDLPEEDIDFLIDGWLARGTVNMLSGESGSGKSSVALKMCHCVVTGESFAGFATQRGPAAYFDGEQPRNLIREKYVRFSIARGVQYWGAPWAGPPPALSSPIVMEYVVECEPKPLIVVDSFVKLHPGDENSSTETRAYMDQARALANLGACVVFLHHTGKADTAKTYRGSSDIPASLDAGWLVTNLGESGRLDKLLLKNFKARFSLTREAVIRYVDGDFLGDDRPQAASLTVADRLTGLLRENPGARLKEFERLAASSGISRSRAMSFLHDGVRLGQIRRETGANNAKLHYLQEDFDALY